MMKIALAGIGEIAVQQHVPAIAASPDWELVATCSRNGSIPGIEPFTDMDTMLDTRPDIEVVSLCQPPRPRLQYAIAALAKGRHVMLEKPPGATVSECLMLEALARSKQLSLYASWHSREADRVETARTWLADKRLNRLAICWREDVRRWHAGQQWIWEPGGYGVFDPGMNALSIVTSILPDPIHLNSATLFVPSNKSTPISADLEFAHPHATQVSANFDWRETGAQRWDIDIETNDGSLQLLNGGSQLIINGVKIESTQHYKTVSSDEAVNTLGNEYPRLYANMAQLTKQNEIDMDLSPLRLVADAFMLGETVTVEPFYE